VDHNEDNRRVLRDHTTTWGMRSGTLDSGKRVLDTLRAAREIGDPYHFVLLDFAVPGMDGVAVAAAIKADPAIRDTLVILLTSAGQGCELIRARGAHADTNVDSHADTSVDATLVNPVRQSQLLRTLATVWSQRLDIVPAGGSTRAGGVARVDSELAGEFAYLSARVLVAEDNPVNRKVTGLMLRRVGILPDMAANGRKAVEMFGKTPYDLILMDCQMPELDGYAATREIRSCVRSGRRVVIVAMTADAMQGSRELCAEAGMDDFISKPVDRGELSAVLRKWLAHPGTEAEVSSSPAAALS
jgi:CheY-like chemotaxis protein